MSLKRSGGLCIRSKSITRGLSHKCCLRHSKNWTWMALIACLAMWGRCTKRACRATLLKVRYISHSYCAYVHVHDWALIDDKMVVIEVMYVLYVLMCWCELCVKVTTFVYEFQALAKFERLTAADFAERRRSDPGFLSGLPLWTWQDTTSACYLK